MDVDGNSLMFSHSNWSQNDSKSLNILFMCNKCKQSSNSNAIHVLQHIEYHAVGQADLSDNKSRAVVKNLIERV